MDKRYQVFVSSTFADLQDERRTVIQTLMEMDCIPAGMELFPAADEEQWQFIKRVIDDCDYYLLIIGGRYGSLTPEGISYTEMEYDFAVERGLKVIALIHGNPTSLSFDKSEASPEARKKLEEFREKATTGRLVRFWTSPAELPGLVALSLSKTIKMYPAVGWVRANTVANTSLLEELNTLRKRNEELHSELAQLKVAGSQGGSEDIYLANLYNLLSNDKITVPKAISRNKRETEESLLHALLNFADELADGVIYDNANDTTLFLYRLASKAATFGLTAHTKQDSYGFQRLRLSKSGVMLLNYARRRLVDEHMNPDERTDAAAASRESGSSGIAQSGNGAPRRNKVRSPRKDASTKRPMKD
jgi:hypothetical protein